MLINNQVGFHGILHSHQCEATTTAGHQCGRRVVIGTPLCWSHLLSLKHLRIKQSTIPGAGKGLFAEMRHPPANNRVFKRGAIIADYTGEHIDLATLNQRYPGDTTAPYAVEVTPNDFIDAALERGYASICNHGTNANRNVRWSQGRNGAIRLVATKNILNGTELKVNYREGLRGRQGYQFQDNHVMSNVKTPYNELLLPPPYHP